MRSLWMRVALVVLVVAALLSVGPESPAAEVDSKSAAAEFGRVFSQWKDLLSELRELKEEYKTASPDRQTKIESRYDQLAAEAETMQAKLIEAAENAYREAPGADEDVTSLLVSVAVWRQKMDDYEKALPVAETLIDEKVPVPQIYEVAGVSAAALCKLDLAEKYLKLAAENDALSEAGARAARTLPYYKQVWPKEEAIRAKEAAADDLPRVLLKTNRGEMVVELFENEAPNTVANFISLVEEGFYDGTPFHRVLPGFVAQGGDPTGTGGGGPGYTIRCECYQPDHRLHFRGSLSMAHAGRDTGGSQFFLTFVPIQHLDGKHTVFGRVIDGMDVLSRIQRCDPDESNQPKPDKIIEAKVLRKRDHPYVPKKVGEQPSS